MTSRKVLNNLCRYKRVSFYVGNLLPSTDTTILVKIQQQIISKILRQHVSAVESHHQTKAEQRSGTWVVCTLVHTTHVPESCSNLA